MKKWILTFIYAFGLNLIWENLHSFLYTDYKGGPINVFILVRASLVDAFIILGLIILFRLIFKKRRYSWVIILAGIIVSVFIEKWALGTGRWLYKDIMPIIPILNIGLTPAIQLGLLGYIVYMMTKSQSQST